jgi:hypothetical protein
MDNDADNNATTQTMGDNSDNNNAPPHRQQGDVTTSQKRVVVGLVRARAVAVALVTAVAAARLVVVVVTVTLPVAAARLVAVDLYVSGRMLGLKENLDLMLLSSSIVVVNLVLLNDACRKERK